MNDAGVSKGAGRAALCAAALLLLACVMALFALPGRAAAEPVADDAAAAVETITTVQGAGMYLGRDYAWAGNEFAIDGSTVENDLLLAGRTLTASGLKVAGSIRAAGQDVVVRDSDVAENISLAGETVLVAGGTANDVSVAGDEVTFEGTCESLHAYGSTVVINGTVNGDANVSAKTVEIGPNAIITGKLTVDAAAEPIVPATATIGDMDFTLDSGSSWSMLGASTINIPFGATGVTLTTLSGFLMLVLAVAVALLSELLFRRQTANAVLMFQQRLGKTVVSGLIGIVVVPLVMLLLLVLIITVPLAFVLILALAAIAIVSTGFIGAALGRMFLPKMSRVAAAFVGGLVLGLLCFLPYLGFVIPVITFILMLGYVLQRIFLSSKGIELEEPGVKETVGL